VTTSGSITSPVFGLGGMVRRCLEGSSAVSSADPGTEDEGVAAVEGDGWLNEVCSRRVRHMISSEMPYMARQLSVF
jgi:hypothetical protein